MPMMTIQAMITSQWRRGEPSETVEETGMRGCPVLSCQVLWWSGVRRWTPGGSGQEAGM